MSRPTPPLALALLLAWGLAPSGLAPGWSARVREAIRSDLRNGADTERMERGYYETLVDASRRLDLASTSEPAPTDFGPLTVLVPDVREYVLRPDVRSTHRGASWSTNARGMRDRDYLIDKPDHTDRIAIVGDSIGAGWGVDDGQGFEPTWERVLDDRSRANHGPAVEILNHAVPGHAPGQRWDHFRREGWRSKPDLVVFQGTPADFGWDDRKLRSLLPKGIGWDTPSYQDLLTRSGIRPGGDEESYKKALRPLRDQILAGVYRTVADDCRSEGVPSVWLLLPRVGKPALAADRSKLVDLARSSGFSAVVDLSGAFDGIEPATLAIAPNDFHPNARGHALLARLIDENLSDFWNHHRTTINSGGDQR